MQAPDPRHSREEPPLPEILEPASPSVEQRASTELRLRGTLDSHWRTPTWPPTLAVAVQAQRLLTPKRSARQERVLTPTPPDPQEARKRTADVSAGHNPDPRRLTSCLQASEPTVRTAESSTRNALPFSRKLTRAPDLMLLPASRPQHSFGTHPPLRKHRLRPHRIRRRHASAPPASPANTAPIQGD
jgi:hypothetical protein